MITSDKLGAPELIYNSALQMGLQPSWVTPGGLFSITVQGSESYINFARSPLNSHVGVSIANDKNLARLILQRNNLPNIPFVRPKTLYEAKEFLQQYVKIVAKPFNGYGSRDIRIVTDPSQLDKIDVTRYILEKYIAGIEMRYLVLNDGVIGVHQSSYGTSVDEHRNLERLSHPKESWDQALVELSVETARVIGLKFAAVDYILDESGHAYILEVNSLPGLKWFHSPTSGPVVDVARLFLEAIVDNHSQQINARSAPSSYIIQSNEGGL